MSETFVSQHYRGFNQGDIEDYLRGKLGELRTSGNNWVSKHCPFCHDDKNRPDNMWKLAFTKDTGAYRCPRCGSHGSFWDFKKAQGDIPQVEDWEGKRITQQKIFKKPDQNTVKAYPTALQMFPEVIEHLCIGRKLKPETLKHYKVGASLYKFQHDDESWQEHLCITFPWIEFDQKGQEVITRVKARAIDQKAYMRLDPVGGAWGWFGWHTVPQDAREVVITEGEYDAMSVWQETGMYAISLPNGCRSLPPELIAHLERFERIYWWLDDDVPGQEGVEQFAMKVGRHRSFVVKTRQGTQDGPKDANEALMRGSSLKKLLEQAIPAPHDQILTVAELRDDIYRELVNPGQTAGIPCDSLPLFNVILKGHRRGELTVFTGPSGAGKTTVLSQLSLDFAARGVPTLWGSFEIKNHRLAKKMLKQYAKKNLEENIGEFGQWFDRFQTLPLYFMRFFGSTNIDAILEASDYCVYQHDVAHIILDNLQFMTSKQGRGVKKFDIQEEAIDKAREFATSRNVHLTMVIHPKKAFEGKLLDTSDLGGTAKAEQEADNVVVLQRGPNFKFLDIKKNRYDGDLGQIPYRYDKITNRIVQLTDEELKAMSTQGSNGSLVGSTELYGYQPPSVPKQHTRSFGGKQYRQNPGSSHE